MIFWLLNYAQNLLTNEFCLFNIPTLSLLLTCKESSMQALNQTQINHISGGYALPAYSTMGVAAGAGVVAELATWAGIETYKGHTDHLQKPENLALVGASGAVVGLVVLFAGQYFGA